MPRSPKNKEMKPEEIPFEDALAEIDRIVAQLESGELPLDRSLEIFQRGMTLIDFCSKKLQAVESKLKILLETPEGGFTLEDAE